ncbi:transcriptional regulator [Halostagnicola larsenii XH-48]|uniref:Transcriptional regulator n=1 Tax=Halostagnicola larsenii XH-48 TaxID=797299 RepID=W0JS36_9EURY|nr:helix-turn-helix domain-containing protein [Halostagnicola larsenii]AHG00112.1 transcriptional regulator [Halostagnicola larsenii XH-48]
MSNNPGDEPASRATKQLEAFGLSTYAARTFVAFVSLGDGTAQDVSDVSEVPRTRVYDAAAELRDRGLVDVQHSSPRRFVAISSETAGRRFKQDYVYRANELTDALDALEPKTLSSEQRGVWTVTGQNTITERLLSFIEEAMDEIVYMTVEDLLCEKITDALLAASDRGVTIRLAGMSTAATAEIHQSIPNAEPFDSLWDWSDMPAGRLSMVDQEKTLASVLVAEDGSDPSESRDETAIWGMGETNSLVMVLKAIFTWQLDGSRDE